ncbi:hypothetical protein QTP86_013764 [Hemibagrus guttatus]|nr:hypothetical protein QTP86_013764 [Hemibagrus guttatus]
MQSNRTDLEISPVISLLS